MKLTVATTVFAALCAVAFTAAGHGGEDHDAPPPPVNQSVAPRAVAATEEFEVVAVLEDRKLLVYVDRFASNEPVAKAKVEVEGAGLQGLAAETAPGTYTMVLATPLAPARYPLTITVEAGDSVDLLTATLDTSAPATSSGAAPVPERGASTIWKIAAVLLLVAVALLLVWRRSAPKGN